MRHHFPPFRSRARRPGGAVLGMVVAAALGTASLASPLRSGAADRVELTVTLYSQGTGLVHEVRRLMLPAGTHRVEFGDVPERLDPASVEAWVVEGPPARILDQRFEYDLLGPETLLEKYIGREVELVTRDHQGGVQRVAAVLLGVRGGRVFRVGDRIWLDHPGEVVLPALPEGLRERPAVLWTVQAEAAGTRRMAASYLADGLGWDAHYSARLDPGGQRLDLSGWVTLRNESGTSLPDARWQLVAGDVRRVGRVPSPREGLRVAAMASAEMGMEPEPLQEYHLYRLPDQATLEDRTSMQVRLLGAEGVAAARRLVLEGTPWPVRAPVGVLGRDLHPEVRLEMANAASSGLGRPLPAGIFRVFQEEPGGPALLVGEGRIPHTAPEETIRVALGTAFDVTVDRVQTDFQATASGRYDLEAALRLEVRNRKEEPVTVLLREPVPGDWQLIDSSIPARKVDARTLEFTVEVPAGGTASAAYRVAVDTGK